MDVRRFAFNALNNMNYSNPNMGVTSRQFGRSTDIYSQNFGHRLQLGLRLEFSRGVPPPAN
jgi:hypothetical protein